MKTRLDVDRTAAGGQSATGHARDGAARASSSIGSSACRAPNAHEVNEGRSAGARC